MSDESSDREPRYVVIRGVEVVYATGTLADALDFKGRLGGLVYEPLAMSAAERVAAEPSTPTDADRETVERECLLSGYAAIFGRGVVVVWLAGLAAGRAGLTWAATPPRCEGHWWWRERPDSPRDDWEVKYIYRTNTSDALNIDTDDRFVFPLAAFLRDHPGCQWSSAPIPVPSESPL